MYKIGNIFIEDETDKRSFCKVIEALDLTPPVIIKPNWGFSVCFTEAEILDWVLEVIDGEALIIESYGWARTREALDDGSWGSNQPDQLRESDRWFFEYSGIGEVLKKYQVEFLNITEENWAQRITSPELIREHVQRKHTRLEREDFYKIVPQRLYEMKGCDLLSLAKVRLLEDPMKVSFAIKNFFGMIPGPSRAIYHGEQHAKLNQSIVDIYKVYASLFNIRGVVEAVFSASLRDPTTFEWHTRENPGFVAASEHPLALDALVTALISIDPNSVAYLDFAAECLGGWDEEVVEWGLKSSIQIL